MRTSRLRGQGHHFVHAVTRIVGRDFLLGDREKEHFWKLIQSQSGFSGVRVVTACIMANHVHLFLEEPERERIEPLLHFGSKRSRGARRMRGADWGDLCVIRDLWHEVIT